MNSVIVRTCIALLLALYVTGCRKDAKSMWNDAIKKCANNDQLGKDVVYFGPSNTFAPGTTFAKLSDGAIQGSYLPKHYNLPGEIAHAGAKFSCDAVRTTGFKLDAKVPLAEVTGVPADLGATLSKSSSTTVKAGELQWDELLVGPFNDHIGSLPSDHPVKKRLLRGEMVLARALRVRGLEATLKFATNIAPTVKAQIPTTIVNAGTGVELTTTWTDDVTLVLKSAADFYIAGELRTYDPNGLSAQQIGPVVTDQGRLKVVSGLAQ